MYYIMIVLVALGLIVAVIQYSCMVSHTKSKGSGKDNIKD
jgi:hypothetical protein